MMRKDCAFGMMFFCRSSMRTGSPMLLSCRVYPNQTRWSLIVDTMSGRVDEGKLYPAKAKIRVPGRTFLMFCRVGSAGLAM